MRRLPIAFLILCLLAALCVGTSLFQRAQTIALTEEIDRLSASFDETHPEKSLDDAEQLLSDFGRKTALFPLFLRHSGVSEVEAELNTLPALMTKGEPKDVSGVLLRCRRKLQSLYEWELPTIENIF